MKASDFEKSLENTFNKAIKEELTNNGKPHVCNELAVYKGNADSVSLCPICGLPVDD